MCDANRGRQVVFCITMYFKIPQEVSLRGLQISFLSNNIDSIKNQFTQYDWYWYFTLSLIPTKTFYVPNGVIEIIKFISESTSFYQNDDLLNNKLSATLFITTHYISYLNIIMLRKLRIKFCILRNKHNHMLLKTV